MLMVAQYKLRGGQEMKEDLSCDLLIPLKDVFVLIILLFEDFDQKSPVSFGSVFNCLGSLISFHLLASRSD